MSDNSFHRTRKSQQAENVEQTLGLFLAIQRAWTDVGSMPREDLCPLALARLADMSLMFQAPNGPIVLPVAGDMIVWADEAIKSAGVRDNRHLLLETCEATDILDELMPGELPAARHGALLGLVLGIKNSFVEAWPSMREYRVIQALLAAAVSIARDQTAICTCG